MVPPRSSLQAKTKAFCREPQHPAGNDTGLRLEGPLRQASEGARQSGAQVAKDWPKSWNLETVSHELTIEPQWYPKEFALNCEVTG